MKTTSRFIFTIAFILLACGSATAQTPKIKGKWQTEPDKNFDKTSFFERFLGQDDDNYYLLIRKIRNSTYSNTEYDIAKYDKKTLSVKEQKKMDPTVTFFEEVYDIAGETYAHIWENPPSSAFNAMDRWKNKKHGFYKFNTDKMEFELLPGRVDFLPYYLKTTHCVAPDSSKILFVYNKISEKENLHRLVLLDREMNKIWENELVLPFPFFVVSGNGFKSFYTNATIALDNDGAVYFAGRIYSSNTDYDYQILKYNGEKFSQNFKLAMNGLKYHNCQVNFDKNNNLFAVGFYSENEKKAGGYYFTLDKNMTQAKNLSLSEIKAGNLFLTDPSRTKKKTVGEILEEFAFLPPKYCANGDIVMGADGAINLATPETQTRAANGRMETERADNGNPVDTYVFRIKPGSGIAWLKRVAQKQVSTQGGYYASNSDKKGCLFFVDDDNVTLLFNDHPKNAGLDENAAEVRLAWNLNVKPMTVIIDKNGSFSVCPTSLN
ncbi:MAG: hypothetical protein LBR52_03900 [Prevotellaceae bacterium]|jgi:hypothetical protein|nr:hypothetical protein [Prevotellaceae bacterium]